MHAPSVFGIPAGSMTYHDLAALPEDRLRHEIIDGVHHVTPSPARAHQLLLGCLHLALGNYLEAHPLGDVYLSPFDVLLSKRRDLDLKRRLYEAADVSEYWIVDPKASELIVHRRPAEGRPFSRPRVLTRKSHDVLTTPLLPKFELALDRLFR